MGALILGLVFANACGGAVNNRRMLEESPDGSPISLDGTHGSDAQGLLDGPAEGYEDLPDGWYRIPDGGKMAPCPWVPDDPDGGRIGCGAKTCDERVEPICLVFYSHDGVACEVTACDSLPPECASSPSCGCLQRLPEKPDAGPGDGGGDYDADYDRFCGASRTSIRSCSENGAGFRVSCSPI
jgi:hypothetical protein